MLTLVLSITTLNVFANQIQLTPPSAEETLGDQFIEPLINSNDTIELGKSTIFDASQSFIENDQNVKYEWDFGDGNKNQGVEVLHAYKEPKEKTVILTITNEEGLKNSVSKDIFVYTNYYLLITDAKESIGTIELMESQAKDSGTYIEEINSYGASTEFISEEILSKKLDSSSELIQKANKIVIWSKENAGLNALSRYYQTSDETTREIISDKHIIVIADDKSSNLSRIQRQYSIIKPRSITILGQSALTELIQASNHENLLSRLDQKNIPYTIVDEQFNKLRPWNFMSYFVNSMIENGIPDNTIALLLLLPLIATVVALMRQVVGVTTFGVYTPSIITLSFLVIGIYAGLFTLITAIIVGSVLRPVLRKIRMMFIPKMAIVLSSVSLFVFLVIIMGMKFGLFDPAFLSIAIFPMLILATLVEKFVSAKTDKSLWSAAFLMGETLLVSIIAYILAGGPLDLGIVTIKIDFFKNLLLNVPEIVLLFIVANYGLGKWTGLRVLEKIRFREILRHMEE